MQEMDKEAHWYEESSILELQSDAYHDALLVHNRVRDRGVMARVVS
jgi:hypothetical protein